MYPSLTSTDLSSVPNTQNLLSTNNPMVAYTPLPSIGQTWVLVSIGAVVEMGILSTLKRLLMESNGGPALGLSTLHKSSFKIPSTQWCLLQVYRCWFIGYGISLISFISRQIFPPHHGNQR
jgi:hypothetical protein